MGCNTLLLTFKLVVGLFATAFFTFVAAQPQVQGQSESRAWADVLSTRTAYIREWTAFNKVISAKNEETRAASVRAEEAYRANRAALRNYLISMITSIQPLILKSPSQDHSRALEEMGRVIDELRHVSNLGPISDGTGPARELADEVRKRLSEIPDLASVRTDRKELDRAVEESRQQFEGIRTTLTRLMNYYDEEVTKITAFHQKLRQGIPDRVSAEAPVPADLSGWWVDGIGGELQIYVARGDFHGDFRFNDGQAMLAGRKASNSEVTGGWLTRRGKNVGETGRFTAVASGLTLILTYRSESGGETKWTFHRPY